MAQSLLVVYIGALISVATIDANYRNSQSRVLARDVDVIYAIRGASSLSLRFPPF